MSAVPIGIWPPTKMRSTEARPAMIGMSEVTLWPANASGRLIPWYRAISLISTPGTTVSGLMTGGGGSPLPLSSSSLSVAVAQLEITRPHAATAEAALDAGALVVNDVSGGLADPAMLPLVAERGAVYIAMHWRGHSADMNALASYADVVGEVRGELERRIDAAREAGIRDDRLILDPGLGFAKNGGHDWALLAHLDSIVSLGFPVLVGHSRKRFLAPFAPAGAPAAERDDAPALLSLAAVDRGAWGVRVHDVRSSARALAVGARLQEELP